MRFSIFANMKAKNKWWYFTGCRIGCKKGLGMEMNNKSMTLIGSSSTKTTEPVVFMTLWEGNISG